VLIEIFTGLFHLGSLKQKKGSLDHLPQHGIVIFTGRLARFSEGEQTK